MSSYKQICLQNIPQGLNIYPAMGQSLSQELNIYPVFFLSFYHAPYLHTCIAN